MELANLEPNILMCPITQQILKKPVMAEDEHIYEEEALLEWFKKSNKSPITRNLISTKVLPVRMLENIIEDFLSKNPDQVKDQYVPFNDRVEAIKKDPGIIFSYGRDDIYGFILHLYELHVNQRMEIFSYFCKYPYVMKHIIDLLDINQEFRVRNTKRNLIHLVTAYGTQSVIKYLVDKGADLNVATEANCYPIHNLSQNSPVDLFEYVCNRDSINLEIKDFEGNRPIHFACTRSTSDIAMVLINKNVDLEAENNNRDRPIHIACSNNNTAVIRTLIDKHVHLDKPNRDGLYPLHSACKFSSVAVIMMLINGGSPIKIKSRDGKTPLKLLKQNENVTKKEYKELKKILSPSLLDKFFKKKKEKYTNLE